MSATICDPLGLAVTAAGELYLTDWTDGLVRKIDANGVITTVLGGGTKDVTSGARATDVAISEPHTVALGPDASFYVTLEGDYEVVKVTSDGLVQVVAGGKYSSTVTGDNGPPLSASFQLPRVVYVHADGTTWIADYNGARVRRVKPALPEFPAVKFR